MTGISSTSNRPQVRLNQASGAGLSQAPNAQLSLQELWPSIERYAQQYGADPKLLAAIIAQESSFKNHLVHRDGTGHGLIGLDDNGLLPDFERWSGMSVGRGANARTIPPEKQVEYLAKTIGEMTRRHGSGFAAAREWHRGRGGMNDSLGAKYEGLIRGHIDRLFPNGRTPTGSAPTPTPGGQNAPSAPNAPSTSPQAPAGRPSTSPAGGTDYQIKSGDTLWGIASKLKAQGMQGSHWDIINQIVAANPKITDPNKIYAGDTIKLPTGAGTDQSSFSPANGLREPVALDPAGQTRAVGGTRAGDGGKVPYISQYSPAGAANGYTNGPSNCGPTSMAMLARSFGYGGGMSDAQLINHLGRMGGTSAAGTSVNGIVAMANGIGRNAEMRGPGTSVEWMAEQLRAGKKVVANGDYYAMPPHQNEARTSGHYVAVVGMDERGNFIVRDPADQNVSTVTPAQMAHFLRSNPNGGYQIAIS